jgi:hypothetical protein
MRSGRYGWPVQRWGNRSLRVGTGYNPAHPGHPVPFAHTQGHSMADISISVHTNIKELSKKLDAYAYKQLPFATATALTALGRIVQKAEQQAIGSVFDRPTPFTVNSVGVKPARKDIPTAEVFVKDIAAAYLAPYEFGGVNKLNGKALLKPVNQPVNQFGNLGRKDIANLKARSDVFVGKVKTRNGEEIDGVWQRPYMRAASARRGQSLKNGRINKATNTTGHLKLLIRFTDAHKATQHLDYRKRADMLVRQNFNSEMGLALAKAIATGRK